MLSAEDEYILRKDGTICGEEPHVVPEGLYGLQLLLKEQDVWTPHKQQEHWYFSAYSRS